jgi:pimeloyl-ACP methyl ester carboxylesterase
VAAVVRDLGLRGAIGVGHSKGGFAVTMAAGLAPGAFGSLLLVDPVIMERETYGMAPATEDHFAARRRDRWSSAEEMFERFKERPPFSLWKPEVLHDYCQYGLLPAEDGDGFVLACPPRIEAAVYAGSAGAVEIYDAIETIDVPVTILRAREREGTGPMDMNASPTTPKLASYFKQATDVPLSHLSHFIPMQEPGLVARYILGLAKVQP